MDFKLTEEHIMIRDAARDFAKADALRQEILQAGYEVLDVADGFDFRVKAPYMTYAFPRDIRPIDTSDGVSVAMIIDGFTDDLAYNLKGVYLMNLDLFIPINIPNNKDRDNNFKVTTAAPNSFGKLVNIKLISIKNPYYI